MLEFYRSYTPSHLSRSTILRANTTNQISIVFVEILESYIALNLVVIENLGIVLDTWLAPSSLTKGGKEIKHSSGEGCSYIADHCCLILSETWSRTN